MDFRLSPEQVLYFLGAITAATTTIFQVGFYIGKVVNRLELIEAKVNSHERKFHKLESKT